MSYTKLVWKDHVTEHPRTYLVQENQDGTITLVPAPGEIVQQGTPISAENLNHMETGIEGAHTGLAALQADVAALHAGLVKETLWVNPSPESDFTAKAVQLQKPMTQYDYILVKYNAIKSSNVLKYSVFDPQKWDYLHYFSLQNWILVERSLSSGSASHLNFGDAYYRYIDPSSQMVTMNNYLIPLEIIGVKFSP